MPFITVKGKRQWFVEDKGKGDTLFFVHGWAADLRIWKQQTEHFSSNYRVISLDLPGHGRSPWDKDMSFEEIVEEMGLVIKQLGVQDITFVASSMGGLFVIAYAMANMDRVKKISFVGSSPMFVKKKDFPYGLSTPRLNKLASQVKEDFPVILSIFFRSLFTVEERESAKFRWLERFQATDDELPNPQALLRYLEILKNTDLRCIFAELPMPVQFINGDCDYIVSVSYIEEASRLLPKASFVVMKGCGHFPFLSRSKEYNRLLEEFLKPRICIRMGFPKRIHARKKFLD